MECYESRQEPIARFGERERSVSDESDDRGDLEADDERSVLPDEAYKDGEYDEVYERSRSSDERVDDRPSELFEECSYPHGPVLCRDV